MSWHLFKKKLVLTLETIKTIINSIFFLNKGEFKTQFFYLKAKD